MNTYYDVPEEPVIHPETPDEFLGVLMNENDEECDLGQEDQAETEEEQIQRVSQTTGVPSHGAGIIVQE